MKAPWHLWLVGIVALLWNARGAFDYAMTKLRVESYMANFTVEQLGFFYGFPVWVTVAWAIAVWGSLLGSILLLLRRGLAVMVFAVSFLAMTVTSFHNFFLSEVSMAELMGPAAIGFSAAIFIVAILLIVYARAMRQRGVLG